MVNDIEIFTTGIGFVIFMIILILLIFALIIFSFIFWILMIIDCAKRKFKDDTEKITWILILVFLQVLGAIIYYFAVKRENRK